MKRNPVSSAPTKVAAKSVAGSVAGVKVLGMTKDGVRILKPKGRSTHFSAKQLRQAIADARGSQKAG